MDVEGTDVDHLAHLYALLRLAPRHKISPLCCTLRNVTGPLEDDRNWIKTENQ